MSSPAPFSTATPAGAGSAHSRSIGPGSDRRHAAPRDAPTAGRARLAPSVRRPPRRRSSRRGPGRARRCAVRARAGFSRRPWRDSTKWDTRRVFAVLVTGPPGAGKTACLLVLSDLLAVDGIAHAAIDVDDVSWAFPYPEHAPARAARRRLEGAPRRRPRAAPGRRGDRVGRPPRRPARLGRGRRPPARAARGAARGVRERIVEREPPSWSGLEHLLSEMERWAVSLTELAGVHVFSTARASARTSSPRGSAPSARTSSADRLARWDSPCPSCGATGTACTIRPPRSSWACARPAPSCRSARSGSARRSEGGARLVDASVSAGRGADERARSRARRAPRHGVGRLDRGRPRRRSRPAPGGALPLPAPGPLLRPRAADRDGHHRAGRPVRLRHDDAGRARHVGGRARALEAAVTAADLVADGAPAAYACTRPPGHHATRAVYGGSCYLNNTAAAAARLRAAGHAPVAVIDVDAHHGNGTQAIFWEDDDVLTARCMWTPLPAGSRTSSATRTSAARATRTGTSACRPARATTPGPRPSGSSRPGPASAAPRRSSWPSASTRARRLAGPARGHAGGLPRRGARARHAGAAHGGGAGGRL